MLPLLRSLQAWLTPPVYPADAEKTRQVALLNVILVGSCAYLIMLAFNILLARTLPWYAMVVDVTMIGVTLVQRRLLLQGHVKGVALSMAVFGLAGVTAIIASVGTIRAPVTALYIFWVLMVGTFFARRGLVIACAFASLNVAALIVAENAGWLPTPDYSVGIPQWITFTGLIAVAAALTHTINQRALESLAKAEREIEQRKQSEEVLRISEERHRLVAENARDVIWSMDPGGHITHVSPSVLDLRGLTPNEAKTQRIQEVHPPASRAIVAAYFKQLRSDLRAGVAPRPFRAELEYFRKDGSTLWAEVIAQPLMDKEGQLVEIIGVSRDIDDRRRLMTELQQARDAAEAANQALQRANEELATIAITDPLTGVWNRRHFEQVTESAISLARRHHQALSMIMLDLDHFKAINDQHGHQAGDRALVKLSQNIRKAIRSSDVLARWGGEEFVIVMHQCPASEALQLAEKLRLVVSSLACDEVGPLTASFGVAELKPDESSDEWFRRVDSALYEAKAAGRNTVRLAL